MKYLTIALLAIIFCGGGKVRIVETTSQEWAGGLQESGYGTNYQLTMEAKAGSDVLTFGDLWVGDLHMKVRVVADPAKPGVRNFKKGDVIVLKAGYTQKPGNQENKGLVDADNESKPFNFKGEGLLKYQYKGKVFYSEITEFKKLEKIIYP